MRVGGIRSAVRVLKYTTACGVVGSSLWVLHRNHWDVTSVGFLRFGRAAFAVSSGHTVCSVPARHISEGAAPCP